MATSLRNPWRGVGLDDGSPLPFDDAGPVSALLAACPVHQESPLLAAGALAERLGVGALWLKDERARMGLGSFKALGAAYAIARDASARQQDGNWSRALAGRCYVTASAGNHGLSVAAGARVFGAEAVVFLAETVPESFAERLREQGARVERAGAVYEDAMAAAERAAAAGAGTLLSDSAWQGYSDLPRRIMEGYLQVAAEADRQLDEAPTHILLQAGVGGFAAAMAAHARRCWGDAPEIVVVEPAVAPALQESIRAGRLVTTEGPASSMGRLDCKTASTVALAGLARDADTFVTISEAEAAEGCAALAESGVETTPSGAASVAALVAGVPAPGSDQRVLAFVTEGLDSQGTSSHRAP